jgi:hypothetical protein
MSGHCCFKTHRPCEEVRRSNPREAGRICKAALLAEGCRASLAMTMWQALPQLHQIINPQDLPRGKTFAVFYVDAFAKFTAAALDLLDEIGR